MKFLSVGALALFMMSNVEAQKINLEQIKLKGGDLINKIKNGDTKNRQTQSITQKSYYGLNPQGIPAPTL